MITFDLGVLERSMSTMSSHSYFESLYLVKELNQARCYY